MLSTTAGPYGDALASSSIGCARNAPSGLSDRRSTIRSFSAVVTPAGSVQHLRRCALNAATSVDDRLAALSAGASKPVVGFASRSLSLTLSRVPPTGDTGNMAASLAGSNGD